MAAFVRKFVDKRLSVQSGGGWSFDSDTEQTVSTITDEAVFVQGTNAPALETYAFTSEATANAPLT